MRATPITVLFVWIVGFPVLSPILAWQSTEPCTWVVVRHADRASGQDALNDAGRARAEKLSQLMEILGVEAIYSTNTRRTRQTARPTADAAGLPVRIYDQLTNDWFRQIESDHRGQVVLIVGHSNTVSTIVNGLGVAGDYSVGEDDYDDLFIVTTGGDGNRAVRIKYGGGSDDLP